MNKNRIKGAFAALYDAHRMHVFACMLSVCMSGYHPVTGCYILSAVVMVPSWLLPTGAKQPVPLN